MKTNRPTKDIGQKAEEQALQYLINQGYTLRERNYRYKRSEVDLILLDSKTIVFVEVKYRSTSQFGYPEEFVSDNQKKLILQGAENYLADLGWQGPIRFDIIAIDAHFNITHFEDAFY
ncbi:YraN family protein [Reichenbachiella sp.]|uniref:YraN family protein n=1 Tax=Reichenbachiella sp. TaxID=2184521 RepID=UPI003B58DA30